jgi:branched-chain amino acid transport system permease protein
MAVMKIQNPFSVERWSPASRVSVTGLAVALIMLAALPAFASGHVIDKLTTLVVYIMLALMWNALAGYAGLVSVGQQAFFGLGGYFTLRLVDFGLPPYPALLAGALCAGLVTVPLSLYVLRLKGGEFAIAMWVLAEVIRIVVMFDSFVQGETGTSLIAMNAYDPNQRRLFTYWFALAGLSILLFAIFTFVRGRMGAAVQAIRDDEEAASSVGVDVMKAKRMIFVLGAFGCALAGVIWLASAITFQPRTHFGIQWTVYMIFMVLVGGLGTFEGPIIGAVVFFLIQEFFGHFGVWYLAGLGGLAIVFALFLPLGLWGYVQQKWGWHLFPTGYFLKTGEKQPAG